MPFARFKDWAACEKYAKKKKVKNIGAYCGAIKARTEDKNKLIPMSISEYRKWLKDPRRYDASTEKFHKSGFDRTVNVLEGDAHKTSVKKWKSFKARWEPNANDGLTYKENIAIRNWGYKVVKGGKEILPKK